MVTLQELFESQSQSGSMFSYINDQTGFAGGDKFENEAEVRDYFNDVNNLFTDGEPIPQNILDEMAQMVIDNGWWMRSVEPFEKEEI